MENLLENNDIDCEFLLNIENEVDSIEMESINYGRDQEIHSNFTEYEDQMADEETNQNILNAHEEESDCSWFEDEFEEYYEENVSDTEVIFQFFLNFYMLHFSL